MESQNRKRIRKLVSKADRKANTAAKNAKLERYVLMVDIDVHAVLDNCKTKKGYTSLAAFYREITEQYTKKNFPDELKHRKNSF